MIIYYFTKKIKKKLIIGLKTEGGRNFLGRVCVRGQGGGNKRIYRFIDFYRRLNLKGKVLNILYDPNRTARLVLVLYSNSVCSYLILQRNIKLNNVIYSGSLLCDEPIREGFSMTLKDMPLFSNISNIELKPFNGGSLCRAAGTSCIIVGKFQNKGILKLNSKWEIHLSLDCISSFGTVAHKHLNNFYIDKAGKNRALGWKPRVRGVAKNPCDHPHGGGNGKRSKPKIPSMLEILYSNGSILKIKK